MKERRTRRKDYGRGTGNYTTCTTSEQTGPIVVKARRRGLTSTAKRDGNTWVMNGHKRWIGNATWCDVSLIWARDVDDNQIKGFIVFFFQAEDGIRDSSVTRVQTCALPIFYQQSSGSFDDCQPTVQCSGAHDVI